MSRQDFLRLQLKEMLEAEKMGYPPRDNRFERPKPQRLTPQLQEQLKFRSRLNYFSNTEEAKSYQDVLDSDDRTAILGQIDKLTIKGNYKFELLPIDLEQLNEGKFSKFYGRHFFATIKVVGKNDPAPRDGFVAHATGECLLANGNDVEIGSIRSSIYGDDLVLPMVRFPNNKGVMGYYGIIHIDHMSGGRRGSKRRKGKSRKRSRRTSYFGKF